MMITKCSPLSRVRCFSPFVNSFRKESQQEKDGSDMISWFPTTDIYDTREDYVLKMEIPGLEKQDVKIEVEDDTLSVSGERKEDEKVREDDYRWSERRSGKFYRAFRLPRQTDAQKINASMKDGVLELRIPKPEERKPKNIPISVH
jgi:HSP20 family protein